MPPGAPAYYPPYGPGGEGQPPRELPYDEGQPIPPGYRVESHPRVGLIIGGSVSLGTLYLLSALSGAIMLDTNPGEKGAPLFAPVVGPFVAIGTLKASATGSFLLVVDGLGQAAGLGMLIGGIAAPKTTLLRNDVMARFVPVDPSSGAPGLGVVGEF